MEVGQICDGIRDQRRLLALRAFAGGSQFRSMDQRELHQGVAATDLELGAHVRPMCLDRPKLMHSSSAISLFVL